MSARDSHSMPMRRRALFAALLALLAAGAACSDGTGVTGDLSQAEAGQLMSALSAAYLPSPSAPAPSSPGPSASGLQLAPTTTIIADTTETTAACPGGGTVAILNADSLRMTVDVVLNPTPDTSFVARSDYVGKASVETQYAGCRAPDFQGNTWTFDATPGLVLAFEYSGDTESVSLTGGATSSSTSTQWDGVWSGSLGWSYDGKSGVCSIAVDMSSATTYVSGVSTFSYNQTGQVCGLTVTTSGGS